MWIVGISAFYHDSAACLLRDGEVIAAAQEERFSRRRHDSRFPARALRFCLEHAGIDLKDVDALVFYDKPLLKLDRLLETYFTFAPRGWRSFLAGMPVWIREKLAMRESIRRELRRMGAKKSQLPPLLFTTHHQAHAASAYFPSPFERAAVLCLDGVGEWTTTSLWLGEGHRLRPCWELRFPHSLGLLYSAFTYHAGFKVNSAEYKLMGLAPYGRPSFVDVIHEHLIDLKSDGTFRLNLDYFDFATGMRMTNRKFDRLFGGPPRRPETEITQREMDLACSIQAVTEEVVLRLARGAREELGVRHLCLAGGVALNGVANGRLRREGLFDDIYVPPAPGDAGGAMGAALCGWHVFRDQPRRECLPSAALGPEFGDCEIARALDARGARYQRLASDALARDVAKLLAAGKIVGWFQGRMEFGPRALGNRSILADPRRAQMQRLLNARIKRRESFRPFAPAVPREHAHRFFTGDHSPYMSFVESVRDQTLPAVTHVDGSARLQTVEREAHPRFHALLEQFGEITGTPVLLNTSFNVRGEPIVLSPEHAYDCFLDTDMDYLIMGNALLARTEQTATMQRRTFEPD